jgi:predicted nuclease of predicted toxin-antitoxin system
MRFVLDEDVDAKAVGSFLRQRGHECWTVVDAGLGGADDDAVSIYADDRDAILVTHDAEATRRRRKFTFGRHVFLRCHQASSPSGPHDSRSIR